MLLGVEPRDWPRILQVSVETHDLDGRLRGVRGVLEEAGLSVTTEQHWPFEGTDIHMVHAVRPGR